MLSASVWTQPGCPVASCPIFTFPTLFLTVVSIETRNTVYSLKNLFFISFVNFFNPHMYKHKKNISVSKHHGMCLHSSTIYFVCHNSFNTYAKLLFVKYAIVAELFQSCLFLIVKPERPTENDLFY